MLNDDHLLMECDGTATLEDGTRLPIELNITVGDVRAYMANPNPRQCQNCQRSFIPAVRLLGLQEDFLASRIKEKQFKRALKQMGYVRRGPVQYQS